MTFHFSFLQKGYEIRVIPPERKLSILAIIVSSETFVQRLSEIKYILM